MNKTDVYKILAIGFVLVFVFEMFAIGAMNNKGNPAGASSNGAATLPTISGKASEDLTIVKYAPYLIVSGNGSAAEEAKRGLIDRGIATYSVPAEGGFVLNLKSSKDVVSAAAEFDKANATVYASATIGTPQKLTVVGDGMTTKAQGATFTMQIRPIYAEGSSVAATFTAQVENGQLVGVGSVMFQPTYVAGARIPAKFVGETQKRYLEIAWENRSAAKGIARGMNATYKERSYIVLDNATSQQLTAILAATKDYATDGENGVLSVRNDFFDSERAASDLSAAGLTAAAFPPSVASFANDTDGNLTRKLAAELGIAGIPSRLVETRMLKLGFPEEFEQGGKKYQGAGYEVEVEANSPDAIPPGTVVWLDATFEAFGGKITRFVDINVSANQGDSFAAGSAENFTLGADNSSVSG